MQRQYSRAVLVQLLLTPLQVLLPVFAEDRLEDRFAEHWCNIVLLLFKSWLIWPNFGKFLFTFYCFNIIFRNVWCEMNRACWKIFPSPAEAMIHLQRPRGGAQKPADIAREAGLRWVPPQQSAAHTGLQASRKVSEPGKLQVKFIKRGESPSSLDSSLRAPVSHVTAALNRANE